MPPSSVPKLNLGQITRLTPPEVRVRGMRTCTVRVRNVKIEMDSLGVSKVVQTQSLCIQRTHQSTIRVFHETGRMPTTVEELRKLQTEVPTGNDLWTKPVWVSCDCEWFLYTCEVALAKYGCTDIMHSNGVFPIVRNPRMVPMLCKHLIAAAPVAISIGRLVQPEKFSPRTYPMMPGRPPRVLQDLLRKKRLTPTDEEVAEALRNVQDFL